MKYIHRLHHSQKVSPIDVADKEVEETKVCFQWVDKKNKMTLNVVKPGEEMEVYPLEVQDIVEFVMTMQALLGPRLQGQPAPK